MLTTHLDPQVFREADCARGTEQPWAGGPAQPVRQATMRLRKEARIVRPKQAPSFSYAPPAAATTQFQTGYESIKNKEHDADLLRGAYDRTVRRSSTVTS